MKNNDFLSWSGSALGTILTAIQTNEVFQYISLALTILSTLVAIAFTIYKWWKKANEDGKITPEEIDELGKDIKDSLEKGENKDEKN